MTISTAGLIELALKGTAVFLAGWGGALLSRSSAAQRSLLWLAVFATLLLLPLVLVVRPVWRLPLHTAWQDAASPRVPADVVISAVGAVADAIPFADRSGRPQIGPRQWLLAG